MAKKIIVISGVNLVVAGPLSVYLDYLDSIIEDKLYEDYKIIILVGDRKLFEKYEKFMEIVEFPKARSNWLWRLYYEYIYFYFYSRKMDVYCWISMHDMTPNVKSKIRAVYCHNPSISLKMQANEIKYDKKTFLFSLFYKYLYRINIKKNDYVIVQQNWLKELFEKEFAISNVISARPNLKVEVIEHSQSCGKQIDNKYRFVYAAFPRFFKNFEIICEACQILQRSEIKAFEVILTIDGTENLYAKELVEKYEGNKAISFIGLQDRKKMFEIYGTSDCMIFPSRLETWGLPITEFEQLNKPMIVINLPYAHETVGTYEKVNFFENGDANMLAHIMEEHINGTVVYEGNFVDSQMYDCKSWSDLNKILLKR